MALSLKRYTWPTNSSYDWDDSDETISDSDETISDYFDWADSDETISDFLDLAERATYSLPEGVIIEILSWLPVKALLQFKTVCKSWYAIISSPNFVSMHLKNYYNNSGAGCHILAIDHATPNEHMVDELFVDENYVALHHRTLYEMPMYGSDIFGPCDGIYFLHKFNTWGNRDGMCLRALWNPAINKLKRLPPLLTTPNLPHKEICEYHPEIYGFGLDPLAKDYKVILIKNDEWERQGASYVFEYSLRMDCWRYWGDLKLPYRLYNSECYTYVNGVYYWLGSYLDDENCKVILSFDMATDMFREIQVPADYAKPACKSLALYHNSIALFTLHEMDKFLDIWILKKDTEGCCWTKKLTVGPLLGIKTAITHWKNNKIFLVSDNGELLLFDLCTQEKAEVNLTSCHGVYVYKESLVYLTLDGNGWLQYEEAKTLAESRKLVKEKHCIGCQWYE